MTRRTHILSADGTEVDRGADDEGGRTDAEGLAEDGAAAEGVIGDLQFRWKKSVVRSVRHGGVLFRLGRNVMWSVVGRIAAWSRC
jgi:hypothetical protein